MEVLAATATVPTYSLFNFFQYFLDSAELNTQPTEWWHAYTNPGPNSVAIEAYAECAKLVDV
ncbi:MAG: hypothetical protein WCD28_12575 [Nitrososphaeraceae archaeon]